MIFSFLATRLGKFAAIGLAVVLAFGLFQWWLASERKEAVERDRAKAAQIIAERRERADVAAQGKIRDVQGKVETTNEKAAAAARNDPDPLARGFDSLRASKARGDAAPR